MSSYAYINNKRSNQYIQEKRTVPKNKQHEHRKLKPIILLIHAPLVRRVIGVCLTPPLKVQEVSIYLPSENQTLKGIAQVSLDTSPGPISNSILCIKMIDPVHEVEFAHVQGV